MSIEVVPNSIVYDLLLTAITPVSHHDPAVQDESNRSVFNRQKQLLPVVQSTAMPSQEEIDAFCRAFPAPEETAGLLSDLSFGEFAAAALTRLFIDIYNRRNGGEGEGLFTGSGRYTMLEPRLRQAAVRSHTLRGLWCRLAEDMQTTIHETRFDEPLLRLWSLPKGLQQIALQAIARDYRSIVALARVWSSEIKLQSEEYAEAASLMPTGPSVTLSWNAEDVSGSASDAIPVEVPAVSVNTLRHQVVRRPAWLHLCAALGLTPDQPGRGPVPPGVEAIFDNGGNICAGAKAPSNAFAVASMVRVTYPGLDLLGGNMDAFDLGESRLSVAGWLICRENVTALAGTPAEDLPNSRISAFDMLDDVTMTRQGADKALGQMIFGGESLCAGVQVLCHMTLAPYTPALTHGALVAASETFLAQAPFIGGQSARGFGWCQGEWLERPEEFAGAREAYEAYLAENRESLRAGLCDGTLCGTSLVLT